MSVAPPRSRPAGVVFLLPNFDIGGAERVVLRTAARLDRSRFDPQVVALVKGSGRLMVELAEAGVPATSLVDSIADRHRAVWRFWGWLRAERPDVLLTYMFHANQVGRVFGRLAGVPVVVSSERIVGWESRARILANRLTSGLAHMVTTNSEAGRTFWQSKLGLPPDRLRVIYNGVDTRAFAPVVKSGMPLVIGNLARLHVKNDQATLLRALARLLGHPVPWTCLVGGDGPELQALAVAVEAHGLSDRVTFVGHVGDSCRFLQQLDIYAQSSTAEGMPNAVLEAMACGLPCVATSVGGTPEVVVDGTTGYLVPARDDVALARRLGQLLEDGDLRTRMGTEGRSRVMEMFSQAAMVRGTEALLDELLAKARSTTFKREI